MPTTVGGSSDRGNVFRIGIGDNCDGMLTKEVQADGKKHGWSYKGEMDWFWAPDNAEDAATWKTENSFAVPADKAKATTRQRSYGKGYGLEKCGSTLVQV